MSNIVTLSEITVHRMSLTKLSQELTENRRGIPTFLFSSSDGGFLLCLYHIHVQFSVSLSDLLTQ